MRSTRIVGFAAILALGGCVGEVPATDEGTDDSESTGTAQQALAAPEDVSVVNISGNGSGCPQGLADTLTPDRQALIVYLRDMILQHPPGPLIQNTHCQVGITLHVPNGWQFGVETIDTRGFAHLPMGTFGERRADYTFEGHQLGGEFRSRLNGPFDEDYTFTDNVGQPLVWSRCGADATFTINAVLSLNTEGNRSDDAYINTDTIEGEFRKILHWQWRQCS